MFRLKEEGQRFKPRGHFQPMSERLCSSRGILSMQSGRSWRASGDRQISLNASAERAFANFRDKKHRILQLQIFAT